MVPSHPRRLRRLKEVLAPDLVAPALAAVEFAAAVGLDLAPQMVPVVERFVGMSAVVVDKEPAPAVPPRTVSGIRWRPGWSSRQEHLEQVEAPPVARLARQTCRASPVPIEEVRDLSRLDLLEGFEMNSSDFECLSEH